MKSERRIIIVSVFVALTFWIVDALIDYSAYSNETFMDVLLFNKKELTFRLLASVCFIIFGIFTARAFSKQKLTEEELRKTKAYLRTIIESVPECVKLFSRDGSLLHMNRAGLAMIEADSLDDVKGKSVYALIAPKYREAFGSLTERNFVGESGILEFDIVGLKGRHLRLETHAVPLRNSNGDIYASLGITRNVTERRLAEEEREKLITKLQDALANVKTLTGLLPTCAWCRKVRDDRGYWDKLENYIRHHSDADFTHGICPECLKKEDPGAYNKWLEDNKDGNKG
jgi:PAS domain S-box-containing protein